MEVVAHHSPSGRTPSIRRYTPWYGRGFQGGGSSRRDSSRGGGQPCTRSVVCSARGESGGAVTEKPRTLGGGGFGRSNELAWKQRNRAHYFLPSQLFSCLCTRHLMSTIAPFVVGLMASGASYAYLSRDLVTSRNAIMSKHLNAGREELYYPRQVGLPIKPTHFHRRTL